MAYYASKLRPKHLVLQDRIDRLNRKISAALQKDSKLTDVELAVKIGLSVLPCLTRVKAAGARPNHQGICRAGQPEAQELTIRVFIQMTLERQVEKTWVRAFPEIMERYL